MHLLWGILVGKKIPKLAKSVYLICSLLCVFGASLERFREYLLNIIDYHLKAHMTRFLGVYSEGIGLGEKLSYNQL